MGLMDKLWEEVFPASPPQAPASKPASAAPTGTATPAAAAGPTASSGAAVNVPRAKLRPGLSLDIHSLERSESAQEGQESAQSPPPSPSPSPLPLSKCSYPSVSGSSTIILPPCAPSKAALSCSGVLAALIARNLVRIRPLAPYSYTMFFHCPSLGFHPLVYGDPPDFAHTQHSVLTIPCHAPTSPAGASETGRASNEFAESRSSGWRPAVSQGISITRPARHSLDSARSLPPGFRYMPEILSPGQQLALAGSVSRILRSSFLLPLEQSLALRRKPVPRLDPAARMLLCCCCSCALSLPRRVCHCLPCCL